MIKNPPANVDVGSVPGSGRSPGRGHGNLPQYSCLEDLLDRAAWWAIVHRVAKSQTGRERLNKYADLKCLGLCQLLLSAQDEEEASV